MSEEAKTRVSSVDGVPAGSSYRLMASRFLVVFAVPISVWLGVYLFGPDMKMIASYGIPVALLVTGAYLLGSEYLGWKLISQVVRSVSDEEGISAEEMVGYSLNTLPTGYFIIHDYDTGKGNVDHILVCTRGVFTLETKSYAGSVTTRAGKVMKNHRPFSRDPVSQASSESAALKDILSEAGIDVDPKPVVVFPRARVRVRERVGGVAVVSLAYLPKYIKAMPETMSQIRAFRIYSYLIGTRKHFAKSMLAERK